MIKLRRRGKMANARAKIIVSGLVQGVFYRANAKSRAEELVLKGYAKNLPDGNVEIIAEGEKENIEKLVGWCRKGSEMSRVENVDVYYGEATDEFNFFEIR